MPEVTMPKLSDTMEEGKILRWLKQAGDRVEVGDLLVEVETDKADMEVEASAAGVLREVKLKEGQSAPVGAVIAVIDGGGDGRQAAPEGEAKRDEDAAAPAPKPDEEHGNGARQAAPERAPRPGPSQPRKSPPPAAPVRPAERPAARGSSADGVKASPLARSLAEELGVDLAAVRGTGPAGRVTRRDVEQAAARGGAGAAPGKEETAAEALEETPARETAEGAEPEGGVAAQKPAAERREADERGARDDRAPARPPAARTKEQSEPRPADAKDGVRRQPLSKMRATIAKRMAESMREAPHFYLTTVVDMDAAVGLRAQLKQLDASGSVTYNHMVLKAAADALVSCPEVNARFAGDAIEMLDEINLGIATAVDEGLIVPVLHGADGLSLLELAREARALGERLEAGKLTGADLSGATFSVSNLGMFDVDSFTAVINPPQAAILAVGSVKQRAVVRDGVLSVGATMSMTLSCDHRVVDGALGGRFLAEVKRRLQSPVALLLPPDGRTAG
jgi:pyruvate dehydrogenase E2 component (dihydrolipoamide acetyltransferase)